MINSSSREEAGFDASSSFLERERSNAILPYIDFGYARRRPKYR